jgi:hypothetical protein
VLARPSHLAPVRFSSLHEQALFFLSSLFVTDGLALRAINRTISPNASTSIFTNRERINESVHFKQADTLNRGGHLAV